MTAYGVWYRSIGGAYWGWENNEKCLNVCFSGFALNCFAFNALHIDDCTAGIRDHESIRIAWARERGFGVIVAWTYEFALGFGLAFLFLFCFQYRLNLPSLRAS